MEDCKKENYPLSYEDIRDDKSISEQERSDLMSLLELDEKRQDRDLEAMEDRDAE